MFDLSRLFSRTKREGSHDDLGLGLRPGDSHYRAFVGPPGDYDLIAAMTFNLLTTLGLRQHHRVLDIGCGSLRIGRLLIPYLNVGNYTGIEPNRWLIDEGIRQEVGQDQVRKKRPTFYASDSAEGLPRDARFDFAFAQSIFSHCGSDLVARWLMDVAIHLQQSGTFAATFLPGDEDSQDRGWIYPACVTYRVETMARLAEDAGLQFLVLDWKHPRQIWALFSKPNFDTSWFQDGPLTWNALLERGPAAVGADPRAVSS